jgi:hypothetical protein
MKRCRADFWPGPQLGWTTQEPETGRPLSRPLFSDSGQDLWAFRRIRYGGHYADQVSDVTLVNWPQVDCWLVGSRAVRSSPTLLADFQLILLSMGVQLHWREEIQTKVR